MRIHPKACLRFLLVVWIVSFLFIFYKTEWLQATTKLEPFQSWLRLPDAYNPPPNSFKVHHPLVNQSRKSWSNRSVSVTHSPVTLRPDARTVSEIIYPSLKYYSDDRIVEQMKFVPPSVQKQMTGDRAKVVKTIYVINGAPTEGSSRFKQDKCPVTACDFVHDVNQADVVVSKGYSSVSPSAPANQFRVLYLLESPYHTPSFSGLRAVYNWTATYRHDSTIVAPYEKYTPLNASLLTRPPLRNFALDKTKKVAWFVSNCNARNTRLEYAKELSRHIQVDIYGSCGEHRCPRSSSDKCFSLLNTDYKFYLAFENSNCRDYITEKFFINGLKHDVIPIVMGAAPVDYRRAAPPHSFIHVDDFQSPEELAAYLHKLDTDDSLYNQYFAWKGLWDNFNTFFWCRICSLAHDVERRGPSWYEDVDKWWRGPGVCIGRDSWRTAFHGEVIADLAVQPKSP